MSNWLKKYKYNTIESLLASNDEGIAICRILGVFYK